MLLIPEDPEVVQVVHLLHLVEQVIHLLLIQLKDKTVGMVKLLINQVVVVERVLLELQQHLNQEVVQVETV
tara:strand:- start:205 stop:417 length:213 start_codon:yes stop_codon:yes gene_type:complete